jgi:quinol monooxygenase YgiN
MAFLALEKPNGDGSIIVSTMIIVTGSVTAKAGRMDDLLALSLEHVRRSRQEPGCISHAVHRDTEDLQRLFFFEQWSDRDALAAHFAVRASRAFVKAARLLAVDPPVMHIYEAGRVEDARLSE